MKDGHAAPDLWHLTIDDLLTPPPETPRLGGSGPFVINLSASTAPISIPTERFPGCEQLRCYQVKRTENNRWRYRLRIGLVNTELEADAILAIVREHYPSAFTATAGDDDLRAVSEASRTAQARKAHATDMISDKPDEDVEPPRTAAPKAAAPKPAAATPAAPKAAAPVAQPAQPTRWVIMQAPEKKTPPPSEPSDVDPNAITDQVAILELPEDEGAPELTLDDLITPPVAPPNAEVPRKAEPPKMAEPPKVAEPPKMAEPPNRPALRPMKEIEVELRPLFEPTRKAAPAPSAVNDLQAIAELVVIDHDDTLESVVLKNNAMVDSLVERVDVAPQAVPTVSIPVEAKASPAVEAPTARKVADAKLVETGIDAVPELTVEIGELPIPLALAAIRAAAPPVAQPPVIEATFEPPVLTEAVPVVTEVRTPRAPKVSTPPAKVPAGEPAKVVEPPVLTATVIEPPAKPVEPKKFVEFSAQTAKVIEPPPAKVAEPVAKVAAPLVATAQVAAPPAKALAPMAKAVEPPKVTKPARPVEPPAKIAQPVAKAIETPKVIQATRAIETAKVAETAKAVEPLKVVTPTKVEPPRTVKAQLVAGGAAQAIKAASKSHRAIAKLAKAAAKQSKALNRTTKQVAKAAKVHVPKVAAPTMDVEHGKAAVELPPKAAAPAPSVAAPPPKAGPHAAKAIAPPPKAEPHAAKGVAAPPKNVAAASKAPNASHNGVHAPKANCHAAPNGHAVKTNGSARQHNGHSPAPKASSPAPKASLAAQNGHVHAAAKPIPDHKAHSPAANGHARPPPAPTAPSSALALEPAAPAAPAAKPIEILSDPLPPMDSTQTIRALTPLELEGDEVGALWYSIQLSLSEDEVNPDSVPHLDIFDEYRLYSVAGLDQGKFLHALRLGFFSDEGAAQMVAGYLRCYFDEPSVKRVSIAERERFAERRMVASKDIGATGTHTIIELATAPPVPETTLADLSQSAIRRMPEDESLLSRLFAQLKR